MNILHYLKQLSPVYERKEVMSALKQLREEVRDHTLPIAKDAQEAFADHKFKSHYAREVTKALRKRVMFQGSPLDLLVVSFERLDGNMDLLEKEVKRLFAFQFSTSNLTYDRANLMRYIEMAGFYARYFRKLLLRLVAEEAVAMGTATPISWAKAERIWLDDGLKSFVDLYPVMAKDSRDLQKAISQISNAEIHEETHETAMKSIGNAKLNTLGMFDIPVNRGNPFFSMGKLVAEYQVLYYQAIKEEAQALQLRLQELREMQDDGKASPKLQKLIQHTENRVEKLDYKIAKIEDDNRLD